MNFKRYQNIYKSKEESKELRAESNVIR